MLENVIDIKGQPHVPPPVTDFWFAQVDSRLSRIEAMVRKLEWQITIAVCVCAGGFVLEIVSLIKG